MIRKAEFHDNIVESNRIIYTPSAFAKQNLLHIQEVGSLKANKPHKSQRPSLESYLLFLVTSGKGELYYDGKTYQLSAGDCAFVDCSKAYYHYTEKDLWSIAWVHFHGPTADEIYEKYVDRGGLPSFTPKRIVDYDNCLKNIFETASKNDYIRDMNINAHLSKLLCLLMEDSWHPENTLQTAKKGSLNLIRQYLDDNYNKKITLEELSENFFINKYYLSRSFKSRYGVTINSYLQQRRITKAKQLLRFSEYSIEQIGILCGIGPLYYFSRLFKQIEGCSPRQYRNSWASISSNSH